MRVICSTMAHISGNDRSQLLLLPESVDDYVGPDNPVRFIEAFVDSLDMEACGFARVRGKATGRPGYNPADLLKLYIYGYLNRVRSSRRLEIETRRNIEVIWLMRRLSPDFKTIADFRRDNRAAFRQVFRAFVVLCRELDLYGREMVAVDGTRLKAVNSRDRNFTKAKLERSLRESEEKLDRYLKQLDIADKDDVGGADPSKAKGLQAKIAKVRERRVHLEACQSDLAKSVDDQISLTDPDSRAMHPSSRVSVGYNVQLAVDTKHKLIAEQQVHSRVADQGLLAETANAARENLAVDEIEAVADRGYYSMEDIAACKAAAVIPHVCKPNNSIAARSGHFTKEMFRYDAVADVYICPGSQTLEPRYVDKTRGPTKIEYCNRPACRTCDLRSLCTNGSYRKITRAEDEALLEQMAERLRARPELLDIRRETVEHPFGTIKQWMGQGAFLMRRLENVRGEFSLTALAYNIRRAITLVGVSGLIAAAAN